MARNKGTFKFGANFEVQAAEAFDPRVVVENKADLINKETWPYDGDTLYLYNGLMVAVASEKTIYMLVDKTKALQEDYSGWEKKDASAAQVIEIIDNLTSTEAKKALSANQGKVLNDKITELQNKLTTVFDYKGSKATWAELEAVKGAKKGDVWNLEEAHENVPAGTNYAWDGEKWDPLGGTVDLSGYVQKESGKQLIPDAKLALIDTNASSITKLREDLTTEQEARQQKDTELEGKIAKVKSYYEVSASIFALTDDSESGDIKAAIGGDWNTFITAINKAQPVVGKKAASSEGTQNDVVVSFSVKYDKTAENEIATLIYTVAGVENTIKITRTIDGDTYAAKVTSKTFADDAKLTVVESVANKAKEDLALLTTKVTQVETTANAAKEAIAILNGEVGTTGSVKKTATDIANTTVDSAMSWVEVE